MGPGLRASQLVALADQEALEEALDAGAIVIEGERVRPSHPLLAAAARKRARARERRELHLELASVVDHELRARHLALSASQPDATLADAITPRPRKHSGAKSARGG